jgi:hypothetical protein
MVRHLQIKCRRITGMKMYFVCSFAQWRKQDPVAIHHVTIVGHPFSLAGALGIAGCVYQYCGDGQALQGCTEEVLSFSAEHGFSLFLALGALLRGWTMTEQRQQEGISLIRQGLAAWRATGAELSVPYYLALLSGAYGQMRQPNEGLSVLAAALEAVHAGNAPLIPAYLLATWG